MKKTATMTAPAAKMTRPAWWVAWNVDGLKLYPSDSISRSGERFKLDPRLPADQQTGEAVHADNDLDRGGVWGPLENGVLALDGLTERRLSVFAGPVLADDDPTYRNLVQLPREFWKVVVYRVADDLRFKAFLLTHNLDGIEPLRPDDLEDPFLDDFNTYLVGLDVLEDRAGLTFGHSVRWVLHSRHRPRHEDVSPHLHPT